MQLTQGSRVGPYEILDLLGAGGMGEVYRARDTRLAREVALKVLPDEASQDPDRLRRLEHEARAASALNHPNILSIFDVGTHDGTPYVVFERLEGDTLREVLRASALTVRKAVGYGIQIAEGLAAAHQKGICHRDLKPENLFLTRDGRIKILDFGLAKLRGPDQPEPEGDTRSHTTAAGAILGTAAYMSPEQVRGLPADHRSDIFAFGAVLYEMLSRRRPFRGETTADTMTAILKEDPPELDPSLPVPPALDRIVRRCLEKRPEDRLHSAHDLAIALEAVTASSATARSKPAGAAPAGRRRRASIALATIPILTAALGLLAGRSVWKVAEPTFRQLTFRRGWVSNARFAPDGETVVYAAAWEGDPLRVFITRVNNPESSPMSLPDANVLAVSGSGEMAVGLKVARGRFGATLARAPLAGGAPRELLKDVVSADWVPGSDALAVVTWAPPGSGVRVEFPIGNVVYATTDWIWTPRVSPRGDLIALLEHGGDEIASLIVVDRSGQKRTLSTGWIAAQGLAWSPEGDEIWFTAAESGLAQTLHAVTLTGRLRRVLQIPGMLFLHDISPTGRALLTRETWRGTMMARPPGERRERELSWLDFSIVTDLSADGRTLLFTEYGEGGGNQFAGYLRSVDGSPPVRLGEGYAHALSPDGAWVVSIERGSRHLTLLPTGAGQPRRVPLGTVSATSWAGWFPDGRRLAFSGKEPDKGNRIYVTEIKGGAPRPITPEVAGAAFTAAISPDGAVVAATGNDGRLWLFPVAGGEARAIPNLDGVSPAGWSSDGRSMFATRGFGTEVLPIRVYRIDVATGRHQLWREIMPPDTAGARSGSTFTMTADTEAYAYSYLRVLSDLYVVEGLR